MSCHAQERAAQAATSFFSRAEIWWRMAEWCKDGCLPDDPELHQELVAPTYDFDGANRFILEDKDDTKEKLGRSPDKADALA